MGTFMGHILPGSFFIFFGIWHIANLYVRYFKCKLAGKRFFSTSTFPCGTTRFPIEGILKMVVAGIGLSAELYTGYKGDKGRVIPGNSQHITMFTGFVISGLADILIFYRLLWVPYRSDYVLSALAFAVEGVLFAFHQHPGSHSMLEITVHKLLIYVIFVTAIVVLIEAVWSNSLTISLIRANLLVIQGTWFNQIASILYPPWIPNQKTRWDGNSHDAPMYAVMMFCYNTFGCLFICGMIGAIVRRSIAPGQMLIQAMQRKVPGPQRGSSAAGVTKVNSDSESECELFVPTRP